MFATDPVLLEHQTIYLTDKPYKSVKARKYMCFNIIQDMRLISMIVSITSGYILAMTSRKHIYIILTPLYPTLI